MTSFESFGNPRQFEIAARWRPDSEPRSRLPLTDGWSTGELRITVCDQILTEHRFGGDISDCLSWYLSPVIDWFIRNWASLLHEESFAWPERSTDTAAVATVRAIKRYMASPDEADRGVYEQVHYWRARHALRAADSSAIFPDIYFRRVADDIEISWLARQPDFAPENFSLTLGLGSVQLPVSAVATALWEFLNWATSTAPAEIANDKNVVQDLRTRFEQLNSIPVAELERCYVGSRLQEQIDTARRSVGLAPSAIRNRLSGDHPEALRQLADEVGMGVTALVKHLNNIGLIDDAQREQLEHHFGKPEQFDQYRH